MISYHFGWPLSLILLLMVWISASGVAGATWAELEEFDSSEPQVPEPLAPPVTLCPLNCSSHGECDSGTGICSCSGNWTGDGCEWPIYHLKRKEPVSGSLVKGSGSPMLVWVFYRLNFEHANNLQISLSTVSCVMNTYIQYNGIPAINSYYKGFQTQTSALVNIEEPVVGEWYIGLTSTQTPYCNYTLTATPSYQCPNNCSNHGTCDSATGLCICNVNYGSQSDCSQSIIAITSGSINSGVVQPRYWSFYSIQVTTNILLVQFSVQGTQQQKQEPTLKSESSTTLKDESLSSPTASGIYLRHQNAPSLYVYHRACTAVMPGSSCTIQVQGPEQGQWMVGIWGTAPNTYTFNVTAFSECPNQCNNNGICQDNVGTCVCNEFYSPPDCSYYSQPLNPVSAPDHHFLGESNKHLPKIQAQSPALISLNQTQYYTYTTGNAIADFSFFIQQQNTIPNVVLVLYAACGANPSPVLYNYTQQCVPSVQGACTITVLESPPCFWTFAVASHLAPPPSQNSAHYSYLNRAEYTGSSFNGAGYTGASSSTSYSAEYVGASSSTSSSIHQSTSVEFAAGQQISYVATLVVAVYCPNNCSGQGICQNNGICLCNQFFGTDDCSVYTQALANGFPIETLVVPKLWYYYQLTVNMDSYVNFLISDLQGGAVRSYLAYQYLPTVFNYYKALPSGNHTISQLTATATTGLFNGTWTLGVYGGGRLSTTFSVTAISSRICPQNCSTNGVCVEGVCNCNQGYVSADCSGISVTLPSNLEVSGHVRFDSWTYYNLSVLGDDALEIIVQETDGLITGLVWVFLARGRLPTIEDNDYRNQTTSMLHTIRVSSGETRGNWVLGVTGSPRATGATYGQRAKYSVLALSGCGTYTACDTCVLDPNCGWCRNQPFDPAAGRCVPGNDQTSLNQTCLMYQFSTCGLGDAMGLAMTKGLIIGVVVGLVIIIAAAVSALLVYRAYKRWEKTGMRPARIFPDEHKSIRFGGIPISSDRLTVTPPASVLGFNDPRAASSQLHSKTAPPPPQMDATLQHNLDISMDVPTVVVPGLNREIGNYGAIDPEPASDPTQSQPIYYSFEGAAVYTDSDSDGDNVYSSDSEQDLVP